MRTKAVPSTADTGDHLQARAFSDLEPKICAIAHMASLASEQILETTPNGDGFERAQFAVSHLHSMIKALKADYYAAFNGAKARS